MPGVTQATNKLLAFDFQLIIVNDLF